MVLAEVKVILAETLPELLTNPAHLGFEAITGMAEFLIGIVVAKAWVKIHDRKHHGKCDHNDQGSLF